MTERWLIYNPAPRYLVSQTGNVWDTKLYRLLEQNIDRGGYYRVHLWIDGIRETVSVHRIVAQTFLDITDDIYEINHEDGDKSNNAVWNFEVTDRSGNMLHAFRTGLAKPVFPAQRVRIVETGKVFESTGQADRYLGVSSGSVSKTIRGLQPTCKGYTFELI